MKTWSCIATPWCASSRARCCPATRPARKTRPRRPRAVAPGRRARPAVHRHPRGVRRRRRRLPPRGGALRGDGAPRAHRHEHLGAQHRARTTSSTTAPRRRSAATCRAWRSGELVGAIAMTEPGAGSDLQGIRTARRARAAAATCSTAPRPSSPTATSRAWCWWSPRPTPAQARARHVDPDRRDRGLRRLPRRAACSTRSA